MKLSVFKKLIREVIREELDYKFDRLRKELKEIVVSSKSYTLSDAIDLRRQDRTPKKSKKITRSSNSNIPIPKTNNKLLNSLLVETAQSEEWKTVEPKPEIKSAVEDTRGLPDHLASALNKDYSEVMQKVEEKAKFKNGN